MNIFYLSRNPVECSQQHNDKHCIKMILEYAQLLSTAHHLIDGTTDGIYKPTHKNHPSAVWVRQSVEHYGYVRDLLVALCDEYTHRYGKVHKTERTVLPQLLLPPKNMPLNGGWTLPPQCMPPEYKAPCTIQAYRTYYSEAKAHFSKWTNRKAPDWFNRMELKKVLDNRV
jgi:hypothetical protein